MGLKSLLSDLTVDPTGVLANSNYGGLYNVTDGTYFYSGDQQNFELCFNSGQSAGGIGIREVFLAFVFLNIILSLFYFILNLSKTKM